MTAYCTGFLTDPLAGLREPKGDPGAVRDRARAWTTAAVTLEGAADRMRAAAMSPGSVGWHGDAATAFSALGVGLSNNTAISAAAFRTAAGALEAYAAVLEPAKADWARARRMVEEDTEAQMLEARRTADRARDVEARNDAARASALACGTSPVLEPVPTFAFDPFSPARRAARQLAERASEAVRVAGDAAAARITDAEMVLGPRPEAPKPEPKLGFGDHVVGFFKGAGGAIAGTATFLWNVTGRGIYDQEGWANSWRELGNGIAYAWDHPGEAAKAMINWEDLSEGRYGEWLGGLAPDAALTALTLGGGAGVVATRRGADAAEDLADLGRLDELDDVSDLRHLPGADADSLPDELRFADDAPGGPGALTPEGDGIVRHWTPLDSADENPLLRYEGGERLVNSFRSGTFDEVELASDTTLYRVHLEGGRVDGQFWSRTPPAGPLQSQLDLALMPEWYTRTDGAFTTTTPAATHYTAVRVPKGTRIFEGPAGPQIGVQMPYVRLDGGATQVVLPEGLPDGYEVVVRNAPNTGGR